MSQDEDNVTTPLDSHNVDRIESSYSLQNTKEIDAVQNNLTMEKRNIVKYERNELLELSKRRLSREIFHPDIPSLTTGGKPDLSKPRKSQDSMRGRRVSEVAKPVSSRSAFTQSQRRTSLGHQKDSYLSKPYTPF